MHRHRLPISIVLLLMAVSSAGSDTAQSPAASSWISDSRPNLLLIVADDLGLTDLGAFGSEIPTPNMDQLAFQGVRFTNLYSAPTCSPTRAMLMSGMDHHFAGMGTMSEDMADNQVGKPGYEGYLNDRVEPLPEVLMANGYHTYMAGKWHLGDTTRALPSGNGFENSFALLASGASHLNDLPMIGPGRAKYVSNGESVGIPSDFYSTRFFANKMIEYIRSKPSDGRPFFGYLAFTAPHWPLQAPPDSLRKRRGDYDTGYTSLYESRLTRFVELGLTNSATAALATKTFSPVWESLTDKERQVEARKMEIYAAMIADVDFYVGEVLRAIEDAGMKDDTIVIFLSDNGPEGNRIDAGWHQLRDWIQECCDNSFANMGSGDSYLWLGSNWASSVAGPVGGYKGWTHDGGTRVPGFIHFPNSDFNGRIDDTLLSVMDVYPTILELAHVAQPQVSTQKPHVAGVQGSSWLDLLDGDLESANALNQRVLAWELFGRRGVRQGNWKSVSYPPPYGNGDWQLFNLEADPLEQIDVSHSYPQFVKQLGQLWKDYADENGVVLPGSPVIYGDGLEQSNHPESEDAGNNH